MVYETQKTKENVCEIVELSMQAHYSNIELVYFMPIRIF